MSDVTQILKAIQQGDPRAASQLLPMVYDELRILAAQRLAQEQPGQTLQATALVHEAYLRLVGNEADANWNSRGHFFAAAAEAMRRILVESARRSRLKHGGERERIPLDEELLLANEPREDLLALDKALQKLAAANREAADLVQLRYFAGLSLPQAAEALGISRARPGVCGPMRVPTSGARSTGQQTRPRNRKRLSWRAEPRKGPGQWTYTHPAPYGARLTGLQSLRPARFFWPGFVRNVALKLEGPVVSLSQNWDRHERANDLPDCRGHCRPRHAQCLP